MIIGYPLKKLGFPLEGSKVTRLAWRRVFMLFIIYFPIY